ncbi:MAG: N-acetyltransferase [Acidimicrobiaceae bacterium]|nr:N-acetyltransferase [Acidimicrobiaceae bacterium]MBT5581822.1 N-acetyltransferase [Acidimicrobiaceae bacterium]MDG1411799.1 GNAT family N-acetyltransferase [Acidimicrobiales bacterium]MDG2219530.1 GNAT family N-acetyltransferase [Acidimicrobiales bacterium]
MPDTAPVDFHVRDNSDRHRYELVIDNRIVSVADYLLDGSILTVPHVETDTVMRGKGMADRLMRGMLDDLRANERTIRPLCSFAADFIRQHPDDHDLLAR